MDESPANDKKRKIYFRSSRGFTSLKELVLPFTIQFSTDMKIEFTDHLESKEYVVGTATLQYDINEKFFSMFDDISNDIVPEGVIIPEKDKMLYSNIDLEKSRDTHNYLLPLNYYPESFRQFIANIFAKLNNAIGYSKDLVQWITNKYGLYENQNAGLQQFGFDEITWYNCPMDFHVSISKVEKPLNVPISEVEGYIEKKIAIPAHFVIIKEADYLNLNGNLRSSLIMAISAIEIGIKNYIAKLLPDSEWLIFNLPSPPLISIIDDYINQKFEDSQKLELSSKDKKNLRKLIQMRNSLIHGKNTNLRKDHVEDAINLAKKIATQIETILFRIPS